ncbi:MAG: sulfite exporter TauE/SafE family protein [bacterium]|nr:sulfite exporter TauE/SafE family protein [bacterium]
MPSQLLIFLLVAFGAEVVGTVTGFGATTILLPVAALLYPLPQAIAYSALFHGLGTMWRSVFFARAVNWRITLYFGLASLAFAYLGARLLPLVDPHIIAKLLGIVLILYAGYSLVKHRLYLPRGEIYLIGGGVLTGFLAGLIGTAGALRGAFLTAWKLPKRTYLGTGAVMGLGADLLRLVAYRQDGLLNVNQSLVLAFLLVALGGTVIGVKLVKLESSQSFSRIVLVALILAGIRFLLV